MKKQYVKFTLIFIYLLFSNTYKFYEQIYHENAIFLYDIFMLALLFIIYSQSNNNYITFVQNIYCYITVKRRANLHAITIFISKISKVLSPVQLFIINLVSALSVNPRAGISRCASVTDNRFYLRPGIRAKSAVFSIVPQEQYGSAIIFFIKRCSFRALQFVLNRT